ncbi:AMSH-like ubiquitin thioesterase 2 isoform X1 [Tanacetum coccineum]
MHVTNKLHVDGSDKGNVENILRCFVETNEGRITIANVLFTPEVTFNILSMDQLEEQWIISQGSVQGIHWHGKGFTTRKQRRDQGMRRTNDVDRALARGTAERESHRVSAKMTLEATMKQQIKEKRQAQAAVMILLSLLEDRTWKHERISIKALRGRMPSYTSLERRVKMMSFGAHLILTHLTTTMRGTAKKAYDLLENTPDASMLRKFSNPTNTKSTQLLDGFLDLAKDNTSKDLETCGVLRDFLCQAVNEEEIFAIQNEESLFPVGWIHTHLSQSCFMSSVDLHTQYSYQVMVPEAVAIVMAPRDTSKYASIVLLLSVSITHQLYIIFSFCIAYPIT